MISVLVIAGTFLLRNPGEDSETAIDSARPAEPTASASIDPTQRARRARPAPSDGTATSVPDAGDAVAADFPGLGEPNGISGEGRNYSLTEHTMTIQLSSPNPLGLVAYLIPASTENPRGKAVVEARTWSLTTTVYGKPKYGAVYVQAGYDGRPATCVITIDGKVTERRSTKGPYGAMWCLG
ncbi:hypothetical protein ACFQ0K_14865 [Nocardioides caeni]|uniref:Uncharacterized protein n=1 Tax=Nocardioides caeni TaxID=574700 RepID=A0A4S8NDW8_9ACTN|nr:hypothetical protein [Nocardioides caeni]THV14648.1 hypothetical protein E9934_08275 [Nocardioides caeni]